MLGRTVGTAFPLPTALWDSHKSVQKQKAKLACAFPLPISLWDSHKSALNKKAGSSHALSLPITQLDSYQSAQNKRVGLAHAFHLLTALCDSHIRVLRRREQALPPPFYHTMGLNICYQLLLVPLEWQEARADVLPAMHRLLGGALLMNAPWGLFGSPRNSCHWGG